MRPTQPSNPLLGRNGAWTSERACEQLVEAPARRRSALLRVRRGERGETLFRALVEENRGRLDGVLREARVRFWTPERKAISSSTKSSAISPGRRLS